MARSCNSNDSHKVDTTRFADVERTQSKKKSESARTDATVVTRLLDAGAHIIGKHAGDLIAELAMSVEFGVSSEDIARTCHAHPTLNEAVKEAALAVDGRTLNI